MYSSLVKRKKAIIMRNITFAEIKKGLEEKFGKSVSSLILFEAGVACGRRSASRISSESEITGGKLLEEISRLKLDEGWCEVSFDEFDLESGEGRVVVSDSFEALGYGESTEPVCHFLRGYFSGVLSFTLKSNIVLMEEKCIAKKDQQCVFTPR